MTDTNANDSVSGSREAAGDPGWPCQGGPRPPQWKGERGDLLMCVHVCGGDSVDACACVGCILRRDTIQNIV